ncbi:MAG: Re/Si-specific NAD(P)(+) transhydrogenase subunit alpha [Gemmatimonadota bacterium]
MKVGVATESASGETRVALVPETVRRLCSLGWEVLVQKGAGAKSYIRDAEYVDAGATLMDSAADVVKCDVFLSVSAPSVKLIEQLPRGSTLLALLDPMRSAALLSLLAQQHVNAIAMELIPRITRAQSMDVLSSQATVAGYRAVLLAAAGSSRFFPMLMTAAGTIAPAHVLVLGAGVAGLQAIATARRLGAVVQGFDIRPAVKEQVESLGAQWVGVQVSGSETAAGYAKETTTAEQQRLQDHLSKIVSEADVVITTAQVPGKLAPVLITKSMVERMRPGAVIVDLAADSGGNCELTRSGQQVDASGVTIIGPVNLAAGLPTHASKMYSRNLATLLQHLKTDEGIKLDLTDEIVGVCCVTHAGKVRVHDGRVPTPEPASVAAGV